MSGSSNPRLAGEDVAVMAATVVEGMAMDIAAASTTTTTQTHRCHTHMECHTECRMEVTVVEAQVLHTAETFWMTSLLEYLVDIVQHALRRRITTMPIGQPDSDSG